MKTIGFIGLGIMGKPMAKNLLQGRLRAGRLSTSGPQPIAELVAAGAKAGTRPRMSPRAIRHHYHHAAQFAGGERRHPRQAAASSKASAPARSSWT